MTQDDILLTRPKPGVLLATLDRPERMNALTFQTFDRLCQLQRDVEADESVRVLVLTGNGRAFCAGMDLDDAERLSTLSAAEMLRLQQGWGEAISGFRQLSVPVVAAVNGAAAGAGLALALAADIRIAAPGARFNAAFVRIGLSGGDVGTSWALPRLVGLARASEILLTGRFVDAEEADRIGLVSRVVAADALLDEALAIAAAISGNSPLGMMLTKRVLQSNVDAPSLAAALELENRNQVLCTRSPDMAEALAAFREKRPPQFS